MTGRMEHEADGDGIRITRLITTDREIEIPSTLDGRPVVSIGSGFMIGSPGSNGRTLRIPSSVTFMESDMFESVRGISIIEYDGELELFQSFKLTISNDCTVRCKHRGQPFEFMFKGDHMMSFPEFDEAVLNLHLGLTPELALRRLSEPVFLSDDHRSRYEMFVSDQVMPRAEQAVANGDLDVLRELMSTGMISDIVLRRLLERSLRSGRIPVTSLLMSEIRVRSLKE